MCLAVSRGAVVGARHRKKSIVVVQETLEPGASVSAVARRHGANASQVFGTTLKVEILKEAVE